MRFHGHRTICLRRPNRWCYIASSTWGCMVGRSSSFHTYFLTSARRFWVIPSFIVWQWTSSYTSKFLLRNRYGYCRTNTRRWAAFRSNSVFGQGPRMCDSDSTILFSSHASFLQWRLSLPILGRYLPTYIYSSRRNLILIKWRQELN